jgi:uncharacterized protein YhaN
MKFERITIERFGGLTEFDTGEEPLRPLVVVSGPNEAGKSSLFTFLTSMLYGFYPASRDRNPYSPWSGGEIDGKALIRLRDDRLWQVHRRLLASPWGQLAENGRIEEIRNRQLDVTSRIPREVFRKIYALTLADLSGLEGESWDAVQDNLIGSMGASDIVPPREVAKQLEQEANNLWRPDRVGKPRVKALKEELAELRKRRTEARDGDRTIREKVETLAELREELREARQERERCRHLREKIETLAPVRERLLRIDELRKEAGPPGELEGLPAEPRERRAGLEAEVERLEAQIRRLDEEEIEPRSRLEAVTDEDVRLLEHRQAIVALAARSGEVLHAGSRIVELDAQLEGSTRACEDEARELFALPWAEIAGTNVREAIDRVPAGAVRTAIRAARAAAEEARRWEHRAGRGTPPRPVGGGASEAGAGGEPGAGGADRSRNVRPMVAGLLATLGLLLVFRGDEGSPTQLLGLGVLFGGAILFALWAGERRAGAAARKRDEAERREAGALHREAAAKGAAAQARLDELLAGLPLRDAHRRDLGPELAEGILRLQGHLRDAGSREQSRSEFARQLEQVRGELRQVHERVGAPPVDAEPARAISALERDLRRAEEAAGAAEQARRDLERIGRDRKDVEEARAARREELEALDGRLAALGGGDREAGLLRAIERLEARTDAERFAADLERAHADLDALRRRIAEAEADGGGWIFDDEKRAEASVRENELSIRVEELVSRSMALERDIEHMGKRETLDGVEGAIHEVQEEIRRLARERDRRIVLAHLLRKADHDFRQAHQPDIILRAAEHMTTITGGRYRGLSIGEENRERVFYLQPAGGPRPLPVEEPISTGTREQFYLALRLAVVDHLDAEGERLPLFMDEAFVNWDRERRGLGFDLLEQLSGERQIFVFTCHEAMVDELEARGAGVIRLEGC